MIDIIIQDIFMILKDILGLFVIAAFLGSIYGIISFIAYSISVNQDILSDDKKLRNILEKKYPLIYEKMPPINFVNLINPKNFDKIYEINRLNTLSFFKIEVFSEKRFNNFFNKIYPYDLIISTNNPGAINLINGIRKNRKKFTKCFSIIYFGSVGLTLLIALIFGILLLIAEIIKFIHLGHL